MDISIFKEAYSLTKAKIITKSSNLYEFFDNITERLLERISNFQKEKSGWVFEYVVQFQIKFALYEPLKGSSYIPLPSFIAHKKAVKNVKNQNDHECFKWAVTVAVYGKKFIQNGLIKK